MHRFAAAPDLALRGHCEGHGDRPVERGAHVVEGQLAVTDADHAVILFTTAR